MLSLLFWVIVGGIITVTVLAKVKLNERPLLSYIISPSFWFDGTIDEEKSNSYYLSYNHQDIYYCRNGFWFNLGYTRIEGADLASFEVLDEFYARDKHHLYFQAERISHLVDRDSFEIVSFYVIRDDSRVYVHSDNLRREENDGFILIEGADATSFELLDDNWARDKNHYYFDFLPVDIDYASFEILTEDLAKDNQSVLMRHDDSYKRTEIAGQDIQAFDDTYIYDNDRIYWRDVEYNDEHNVAKSWMSSIEYQDISSFNVLNREFFVLDNNVYFDAHLLPNANAKTLEQLAHYAYIKDDKQVFFKQFPLPNADPDSFAIPHHWADYGHDNEHLYYRDQLVANDVANPTVFDNQSYLKTDHHVYFEGRILAGAKAESFDLLEPYATYGKDDQAVYFEDQKIDGIDLQSVEVILREKAIRDANNVFWKGQKVEGADPKSFARSYEDFERFDAEDKNHYYWDGQRVQSK
uniref:DKNYY domain-containing protein n=1 Tax=Thaumasiovibrio occultus TaxID=1891184 RepID=UPI00131E91A2|nr:DKNYY domain-containing protein [Thaumasiovibrio occultus]